MPDPKQGLATYTQAREHLNISRTHLYQIIKSGALVVVYVGTAPRIEWEELDRYVEEHRTKAATA